MRTVNTATRSESNYVMKSFTEAAYLYSEGDYSRAAERFHTLWFTNGIMSARFFEALSLIELGQYAEAAYILKEVISVPNEFIIDARWYLALTSLKTGDSEHAVLQLQLLAQKDGYYQERAKKLLQRLQ
jgi:tetratricopeptide (TPR) repeat protein